MARLIKTNKKYIRAFHKVMEEYLRRKDKTLLPPLDLSVPRGNVDKLKPTDSDFFADVELVWQSIIENSFVRFQLFYSYMDSCVSDLKLKEGEIKSWEQKLGRELIKRGIYPLKEYFRSVKQ